MALAEPLIDRLLRRSALLPNGCLAWFGCTDKNGYGHIGWNGKVWLVHRAAYTLLVGEIPVGLTLDHVQDRGCISRACWNLAHLEPVSSRENTLRGSGPAAVNAVKTHCSRGHRLEGDNLYVSPSSGKRDCHACRKLRRTPQHDWMAGMKEESDA